jgi:hypothetical protein
MKIASGGLLTALAVALGLSCSPANVTDPLTQTCEDYAFAYCGRLQSCSMIAIQVRYGNVATCQALWKTQCLLSNHAPSVGTTAALQAACTEALAGWDCSAFLVTQATPPACVPPPGALPNGAPCAVRQQCQSGFCDFAPGQRCGTCGTPPSAGASCVSTSCSLGFSCGGAAPVTCQPAGLLGQPCGLSIPCIGGLVCLGGSTTTMGTCKPPATMSDAPCAFDATGNTCDPDLGLACNAGKGTCQSLVLKPPGEGCAVVGDQWVQCSAGSCVRGVCVARPALGAPCELGGVSCIPPAECITADGGTTGTCTLHGSTACP